MGFGTDTNHECFDIKIVFKWCKHPFIQEHLYSNGATVWQQQYVDHSKNHDHKRSFMTFKLSSLAIHYEWIWQSMFMNWKYNRNNEILLGRSIQKSSPFLICLQWNLTNGKKTHSYN